MAKLITSFMRIENAPLNFSQFDIDRSLEYLSSFLVDLNSLNIGEISYINNYSNDMVGGGLLNGDVFLIEGNNLIDESISYSINEFYYSNHSASVTASGHLFFPNINSNQYSGNFDKLKVVEYLDEGVVTSEFFGLFPEGQIQFNKIQITMNNTSISFMGDFYKDSDGSPAYGTIRSIELDRDALFAGIGLSFFSEVNPNQVFMTLSGLDMDLTEYKDATDFYVLYESLFSGNDQIIGSSGNEILYGRSGNDVIDGGLGADTMFGGIGNDTYFVDSPDDEVIEHNLYDLTMLTTNAQSQLVRSKNVGFSENEKYIYFLSDNLDTRTNLVSSNQLVIKNLETGEVKIESKNDYRYAYELNISLSNDASFIAYEKDRTNSIQLINIATGEVQEVASDSVGNVANGFSYRSQISADDRYVLFQSHATNLVESDTNNGPDLFLKNTLTGGVVRVNTDSNGNELSYPTSFNKLSYYGLGLSYDGVLTEGVLSRDGKSVFFVSAIEPYEAHHIFLKNLETGELKIVDTTADGITVDDARYSVPHHVSISDDGRYVAFQSPLNYLTGQAETDHTKVYIKDLVTNELKLVGANHQGEVADSNVIIGDSALSGDGRYILFYSKATNLMNDPQYTRHYIKDLVTDEIKAVFDDGFGLYSYEDVHLSADGQTIYFKDSSGPFPGVPGYYLQSSYISMDPTYSISNPFLYESGERSDIDAVISSIDYVLPHDIENLTLTDGAAISATGNASDNVLIGNSANNMITGGLGDDVMDGGQGNDTAIFNFAQEDILYLRAGKKGVGIVSSEGFDFVKNIETLRFLDGDTTVAALLDTHPTKAPSPPTFRLINNGNTESVTPMQYTGPVNFIEFELLGNDDGDIVYGSNTNDFINLLGGDDAANGGAGDDVLDGGEGSNFLTGGGGDDTIFLDGRNGEVTWSTVTDFEGDEINIWGWQAGVSKLLLAEESNGAAGYTGATFHYDLNNDDVIDTSITFTGLTVDEVPTAIAGIVEGTGYLLIA